LRRKVARRILSVLLGFLEDPGNQVDGLPLQLLSEVLVPATLQRRETESGFIEVPFTWMPFALGTALTLPQAAVAAAIVGFAEL
jgi:hypothetical protein